MENVEIKMKVSGFESKIKFHIDSGNVNAIECVKSILTSVVRDYDVPTANKIAQNLELSKILGFPKEITLECLVPDEGSVIDYTELLGESDGN